MLGACIIVLISAQLYPTRATVLDRTYTSEWAVKVSGGFERANEIASKHGFENRGLVGGLTDVYVFVLTDHPKRTISPFVDKSKNLAGEDGVEIAEQQHLRFHVKRGYSTPTDPNWSKQWPWLNTGVNTNLTTNVEGRDINVQPAWIQGLTGCNVTVGVVDDGVEYTHPDLKKNYVSTLGWSLDGTNDPLPVTTSESHGTSCAGEIGMQKSNGYCGAGVAYNAGIAGIRLLTTEPTDTQEAEALSYQNNIISVYSNSWGPTDDAKTVAGPGTVLAMVFQNDVAVGRGGKGSIFIWAAGNGGDVGDSCAADGYVNSIYTIPIGAASSTGDPAYYDEPCAAKIAVAFVDNPTVPDLQVSTTTTNGMCTDTFDGTSSATPLVSGAVALVLEANPNLTWRDVQYLIVYTANPTILSQSSGWATNGAGRQFHLNFGFGAIDTEAMVTRARHWETVPAQVVNTVSIATASTISPGGSNGYMFTYTAGGIGYLETMVIRMTLTINGVSSTTSSTSNRGDISVQLKSPSGTTSTLLPNRIMDIVVTDPYTKAAYFDWPFKSLHFWGENPVGTWTLTVTYSGVSGTVTVSNTMAVLYGTSQAPQAVANIPLTCDPACARGCSGMGPNNCDVCGKGYYRDAVTLACTQNCTSGTANNGYCYNLSDPDPVCTKAMPSPSSALQLKATGLILAMVAVIKMIV